MKKLQKCLALFLTLSMLFSLLAVSASAAGPIKDYRCEHDDACMVRGELICTLGDLPNDLTTVIVAESGIDFNLYNYS